MIAIGATLLLAAAQSQVTAAVFVLATGSAAGLAAIEFFYVLRGVIWPIYMLDAIGEVGLIVLWAIALFRAGAHAWTTPGVARPSHIQPIR